MTSLSKADVSKATTAAVAAANAPRAQGYWTGVGRKLLRDPVALIAGAALLALLICAVFAPWIAPADPYQGQMLRRLRPIGTEGYPLGADELGRDMLSRLIWGARLSLFMGVTPVIVAFVVGSAIGIFAGYVGGFANTLIMRTIDVFYAFPSVLLAVALSGALGAGLGNALLSLTVVFIPAHRPRGGEGPHLGFRTRDYVDGGAAPPAPAPSHSCGGARARATCSARSSSTRRASSRSR